MREQIITPETAVAHPTGNTQCLLRAQRVAARAHAGQRDKQGLPFITHCERLAQRLTTNEERVVAFLHDTLEKSSNLTTTDLEREGFSSAVIMAVLALTRRPGEPEHSFLIRIANNNLASNVKLVDLEDNIFQCRNASLDASNYESRLEIFLEMKGWPPASTKAPVDHTQNSFFRSLLAELGFVDPGKTLRRR